MTNQGGICLETFEVSRPALTTLVKKARAGGQACTSMRPVLALGMELAFRENLQGSKSH